MLASIHKSMSQIANTHIGADVLLARARDLDIAPAPARARALAAVDLNVCSSAAGRGTRNAVQCEVGNGDTGRRGVAVVCLSDENTVLGDVGHFMLIPLLASYFYDTSC